MGSYNFTSTMTSSSGIAKRPSREENGSYNSTPKNERKSDEMINSEVDKNETIEMKPNTMETVGRELLNVLTEETDKSVTESKNKNKLERGEDTLVYCA